MEGKVHGLIINVDNGLVERQRDELALFAGSLPKRPQGRGLGQAKAQSWGALQLPQGVAGALRATVCKPALVGSWS